MSTGIALSLPPAFIDIVVDEVAARLRERDDDVRRDGWLNVAQAAEYLACGRKRIYDLVSQRRVRYAKDGARLLFRREWLDDLVQEMEAAPWHP